jgi:hypothetical protein
MDRWIDDPHPGFRFLEFQEAGWMEDPRPDFRVLESETQRRRGGSEEERCC